MKTRTVEIADLKPHPKNPRNNDDLKRTRKEAILSGDSYYYTGEPCCRGHFSKRHVTSCGCVECQKEFANKPESKIKKGIRNRSEIGKEKSRICSKAYHKKNRDNCLKKMKGRNKEYYIKNRERIKKQTLLYQKENAKERTNYKKEWGKRRVKADPVFRMSIICRRMLHRALGVAGQKKYKSTKDYLPYTYKQIVDSLESQFTTGMTWDNYGEWVIDHIKPLAYYMRKGQMKPEIVNALDNLQPLWAKDNMEKGSKYIKGEVWRR